MDIRRAWRFSTYFLLLYTCFFKHTTGISQKSKCQNRIDQYNSNHHIQCCSEEDKLYDTRTHLCCGESLYPRYDNGSILDCCAGKVYKVKESLCCNEVFYPNRSSDQYGCCKSAVYDFTENMCCDSQLHELQYTKFCCGNKTYDVYEKYCFQDQEILNLWENKCGGHKYDTREFICCSETLINRTHQDLRCCGYTSFNTNLQNCIDKRVVRKGYRWCPNYGEYDLKTHDCCEGHLKERKGTSWRCCGKEIIDYAMNKCCAGKKFDKRTQHCCGGKVIQIVDKCCAGQVLDKNMHVCCGKTLFTEEQMLQKRLPYHDRCCPTWPDGGTSYDSENFVCTLENKVVRKANRQQLCGREEYNPSVDLCCNSRVFKNASRDGMSCCLPNASIYNPKTHVCCFGVRKKGTRCVRTQYRLRCPRFCRRRKITMRKYCNNFQARKASYEVFKNVKKQMKLLRSSKSCRCVYKKKRRKRLCKGKPCRTFKGLVGILVEERRGYAKLYLRQKMQNNGKHLCRSL
ncbi:uncharacterized protein LOC144619700 [Crassostrea virginica]